VKLAVLALAVLAPAVLLAGCANPETQPRVYRQQASNVLHDATGELQTTKLVLQARIDDRTFPTSADDLVTAGEQALGSLAGQFSAEQPPPGSDRVRDTALEALSDAQDAAAQARIAVRRDDRTALRAALDPVNRAIQSLGRAQADLA
jgi:hypothetical protein